MLKIAVSKGFLITKATKQVSISANGFVLFVSKKKGKSVTILKFKDVTFVLRSFMLNEMFLSHLDGQKYFLAQR